LTAENEHSQQADELLKLHLPFLWLVVISYLLLVPVAVEMKFLHAAGRKVLQDWYQIYYFLYCEWQPPFV
jgi:hypothetical protein